MIDELRVGELIGFKGGVESDNPKFSEIAAADSPAVVGILTSVHDGLFGRFELFVPSHPITFGKFKNFFVSGMADSAGFDPHG